MKTKGFTPLKILLALLLVGIAGMIFSVLTNGSPCLIYNIYALPCPSCGMTRAFFAVLRGDFAYAFWMHPLFWALPLLPLVPFVGRKWGKKAESWCYIIAIILFIGVWVLRMILLFPHTEPMVLNEKALLFRIIQWFQHR